MSDMVTAVQKAASLLGSVKSPAKAKAARINGKKGGRPKSKKSTAK